MLGKLLLAVGEDNVLWGTDSIWYGSPQPAIDAFRAFQIPADLRERYGYPELTPQRQGEDPRPQRRARLRDRPRRRTRARASGELAWLRAVTRGGRRARRAGARLNPRSAGRSRVLRNPSASPEVTLSPISSVRARRRGRSPPRRKLAPNSLISLAAIRPACL